MKLARNHLAWLCAGAVLITVLVAMLVPAHDWADVLEDSLEDHGLVPALLIFSLACIVGTLLMLPSWIFPIAAGAAFGMGWGMVASILSSTLAALIAYLLGRHLLRGRIERSAKDNDTFQAIDKAVKKEPWKVVALLRLSPVLPSGLKSYFLGLTCVKPLAYTCASAAGMLPGIALKVWLGYAGRGALDGGGPMKWVLLGVGVAATVGTAMIIGRVARRRLGF